MEEEILLRRKVDEIIYRTTDSKFTMNGAPVPALTTLLCKICDNDGAKFLEAARLVELFIVEALKG